MDRLVRWNSRVLKGLFLSWRASQSLLSSRRPARILLSNKEDWKHSIQRGFRFTNHELTFAEFSRTSVAGHDLVVPLTVRDLLDLNDMRDLIEDNRIPIPTRESILLCDDKFLLNQALIKNGFGAFVPRMNPRRGYPYILKKRVDEWGRESQFVVDRDQEHRLAALLGHADYFTQDVVTGPCEFAAHLLVKDHRILCCLGMKYTFRTDCFIKGRDRPIAKRVCGCPYKKLFATLLNVLQFEGLCCINYKLDAGRPLILEINPRCGASLCPYLFSFVDQLL